MLSTEQDSVAVKKTTTYFWLDLEPAILEFTRLYIMMSLGLVILHFSQLESEEWQRCIMNYVKSTDYTFCYFIPVNVLITELSSLCLIIYYIETEVHIKLL
jgi:hypothetical protein